MIANVSRQPRSRPISWPRAQRRWLASHPTSPMKVRSISPVKPHEHGVVVPKFDAAIDLIRECVYSLSGPATNWDLTRAWLKETQKSPLMRQPNQEFFTPFIFDDFVGNKVHVGVSLVNLGCGLQASFLVRITVIDASTGHELYGEVEVLQRMQGNGDLKQGFLAADGVRFEVETEAQNKTFVFDFEVILRALEAQNLPGLARFRGQDAIAQILSSGPTMRGVIRGFFECELKKILNLGYVRLRLYPFQVAGPLDEKRLLVWGYSPQNSNVLIGPQLAKKDKPIMGPFGLFVAMNRLNLPPCLAVEIRPVDTEYWTDPDAIKRAKSYADGLRQEIEKVTLAP